MIKQEYQKELNRISKQIIEKVSKDRPWTEHLNI